MTQKSYTVADQDGASFLVTINEILEAVATGNSGATAPAETQPGLIWLDTADSKIKRRNQADDDWVILGDLDEEFMGLLSRAGGAMSGVLQLKKSTDIVAGATTDLGNADGNSVTVTHSSGTVAITSFGGASSLQAGTVMDVTFSISGGTLSLTHNATSMVIPGSANLSPLANGDKLRVRKASDSSANWEVIGVTKADGSPLVAAPDATETTKGIVEKATAAEAIAFTADKYIDGQRLQSAFNATGNAPFYACRAWANFNGTGTIAIRASGNIASITDNGTGSYSPNFITAMPDANYAVVQGGITGSINIPQADKTTTSFRITTTLIASGSGGASADQNTVDFAVLR